MDDLAKDPPEPSSRAGWRERLGRLNQEIPSLLLLGGATVSVLLAFRQFTAAGAELLGNNQIPGSMRGAMAGRAVAGALATLLILVLLALRLPSGTLRRWAQLASPLLLAVFLPALCFRELWQNDEISFFVILGVFGLALEAALSWGLQALPQDGIRSLVARVPQRVRTLLPPLVVAAGVLWYFIAISGFTLRVHERIATSSSDLAEFDNLFFNALHGIPFRSPAIDGDLRAWGALKVHAEWGLYLLLPFYAVRPGPEALLVIQSGVVALTAIPIYLFGARRVGRPLAALIAVAVLLMPAVERPNFYDFHFVPLGMLFVSWTLYWLDLLVSGDTRRLTRWMFGVFFAFAIGAREDSAAGVALLGAILSFSPRARPMGALIFSVATLYFVLMKFGIMAKLGQPQFDAMYQDLKSPDIRGMGSVLATLLTNPVFVVRRMITSSRLLYILHLAVPLLLLWLRRPILLLAAVPGFAFTLLVTNRDALNQVSFQYVYHWIPYVAAAAVLGLEQLKGQCMAEGKPQRIWAAAVALVVVGILSNHAFGALLGASSIHGGFERRTIAPLDEAEKRRIAELRELIAMIPSGASVSATEAEGPHVSTRLVMYSLKYTLGENPDYLLIGPNVDTRREPDHLVAALRSGNYGLQARRGQFTLIARGADARRNEELIREFVPRSALPAR